jgi:hypothetical protein
MKLSKLFRAGIGRAVIMAFAAQVVAGAMCLMPVEAMAAPQASSASAMPVCAMKHAANSSHARHACPHCDAPVQVVSQIDITHGLQAPMPLAVLPSPLPEPVEIAHVAVVPTPRILAPPDSASLIYRTSQRIRI